MFKRYEDNEMLQGKTSPAKLRLHFGFQKIIQDMNASF